jgi:hypothetical protein
MISLEIHEEVGGDWNSKLLESSLGNIFQTKEYGNYLRSIMNWQILFLKFVDPKGNIIAQLLMSLNSRFEKQGKLKKILQKFPIRGKTLYRWINGPVIFDSTYNVEVINQLRTFLLSKKSMVLGQEHPLSGGLFSSFGKPFRLIEWGTFLIDLTLDKQLLWNNLDKKSARKNIERSKRHGVSVKEMNTSDLSIYHKMLNETKHKAKSDVDISEVEGLWKNLFPVGLRGFLSFANGNPIGGILISSFNKYINEWGVARTEVDTTNKLYSQDLLKWHIIEWGINNKSNFYDLTGVNPNTTNKKELGIFRYKEKWGGRYIQYQKCQL